jgi:hypothetical protein
VGEPVTAATEAPEPKTPAEIISALLDRIRGHEWVEKYQRCSRGCCGEYVTECDECGEPEGSVENPSKYRQHLKHCALAVLIAEASSFLRNEEAAALARDAEPPHRPTSWERVAHG